MLSSYNIKRKTVTSQSYKNDYIAVDVRKLEEHVTRFNQFSVEERLINEYIVVTIIVAARGVPELPPIKSTTQLQKALQKLASIPSSNIMGARVLWTPQKEDDHLT
ncbi:hypothetical protein QVD17_23952 [Tagetes erecta]|uniref:Uncharacterized protein n=1 Tax=Tagetes erecta TaxID=13708 RepID=A0AAD8KEM5_TARER|nr:hypothetical protein QVD17_23952 [Tagetes erecta]